MSLKERVDSLILNSVTEEKYEVYEKCKQILLKEALSPEEYEAVIQYIAYRLGI